MARSLTHRIEWLDGLRGIAILMVVWYHAQLVGRYLPYVPWFGEKIYFEQLPAVGFAGVELFFFISGFALYYPYARNTFEGRPLDGLATFAWRRFIKIVPSYLVVLAALFLFGGVAFRTLYDFLATVMVHVTFTLGDWDSHPFGNINGVLWSLSVEVQFYLIFPLLARAMRRYPVIVWLACCLLAWGYRISTLWIGSHHQAFRTQVPAYLDLFASGMFAAYLCVRWRTRLAPSARLTAIGTATAIAGTVATAALLASLWELRWMWEWRDSWAILGRLGLSLAFAAIACGSTFAAGWWRRALGNPVLIFLSVISYNLYLWHHFIFLMLAHAYPDASTGPIFTLLATTVALGAATFLTYFFERPLLLLSPPWQKREEDGEPAAAES